MNNQTISLLSVDAWRDGAGWTWNNWHKLGMVPLAWCDLSPCDLLRNLRKETAAIIPVGAVTIEDDGYNLVVVMRGTREPLCAIAYGEAE